jgi:hypothetical protein
MRWPPENVNVHVSVVPAGTVPDVDDAPMKIEWIS